MLGIAIETMIASMEIAASHSTKVKPSLFFFITVIFFLIVDFNTKTSTTDNERYFLILIRYLVSLTYECMLF